MKKYKVDDVIKHFFLADYARKTIYSGKKENTFIPINQKRNYTDSTPKSNNSEFILSDLKNRLNNEDSFIPIQFKFKFTKGHRDKSKAYLYRDKYLENRIKEMIDEKKFKEIISAYDEHDSFVRSVSWPKHYPMRIVYAEGQIAKGENIFMFFPEAAEVSTGKEEDYFGFEFINMWEKIFDQIVLPCVQNIFDTKSQLYFYKSLRSCSLAETIYLASIFHELGHRYGFWKVSPQKHPNNNLSPYHFDIVGELWTDSLLVSKLSEFESIASFVLLQRLFWFGRRGFSQNNLSANINLDNDCWIGSYLWKKCSLYDCIRVDENGEWMINHKKIVPMFKSIVFELETLSSKLMNCENQDVTFRKWMEEKVDVKENLFVLPIELRKAFERLVNIPEVVAYQSSIHINEEKNDDNYRYSPLKLKY